MAGEAFYITGGTAPRGVPCYVTPEADQALNRGLSAGELCYVLTPRQVGASPRSWSAAPSACARKAPRCWSSI